MYTKNEICHLVAMSVPKMCICIVVFTFGTINPLDVSVKYRIVYFLVEVTLIHRMDCLFSTLISLVECIF